MPFPLVPALEGWKVVPHQKSRSATTSLWCLVPDGPVGGRRTSRYRSVISRCHGHCPDRGLRSIKSVHLSSFHVLRLLIGMGDIRIEAVISRYNVPFACVRMLPDP